VPRSLKPDHASHSIVDHTIRHLFFRSYEARLQSSLRTVLSSTLGHLSLSTCVGLRYDHLSHSPNEIFLSVWHQPLHRSRSFDSIASYQSLSRLATDFNAHIQPCAGLAYCVPRGLLTQNRWYPNINGLSVAYAFRPQLRID
jgi:hypothetical protein